MIHQYHFTTSRTARYCTLGNLNERTEEIWLVVHGYAQLASDFIKHFESILTPQRFFIAPEGLSRFYAKGFGGSPVASWMTSEDRLNEIHDYVNFIEQLMKQNIPNNYKGKIMVLGFSQGVATVTRWMHASDIKVDELIIYAGQVGEELTNPISPKLLATPVIYITGNKDPILKYDQRVIVQQLMADLNARIIEFEGGHEVKGEVLKLI